MSTPNPSKRTQPAGRRDEPLSPAACDNPVHWWAWGEEALAEASAPTGQSCSRSATPPVIGAMSWRMRASNSTEVAAVMNELFVTSRSTAKNGRRRRHLHAVAAPARPTRRLATHHVLHLRRRTLLGRHLFSLPGRYGGGFVDVLNSVARTWHENPSRRAEPYGLLQALREHAANQAVEIKGDDCLIEFRDARSCRRAAGTGMRPVWGGVGKAPKFPRLSIRDAVGAPGCAASRLNPPFSTQ